MGKTANNSFCKPRVLDLFSGCGGLSLGLEKAGFEIAWANEMDKDAANSFLSIHPQAHMFNENIDHFIERVRSQDTNCPQKGDVQLIAGGPPCQGFSGYNRHRKFNDPRNSLVHKFLSLVEYLDPETVLIENVPGMLQMESGRVPDLILDALNEMGYYSKLGILQAGFYGLPQNRWRVFIVAAKITQPLKNFLEPTHAFPKTTLFGATNHREHVVRPLGGNDSLFNRLLAHTNVNDAIGDLPGLRNGEKLQEFQYSSISQNEFQNDARKGSSLVYNHHTKLLSDVMIERIQAIPKVKGAGWLDLPERLKPKNLLRHGDNRYPNRFGRLWWDGTFNTIVSKPDPYWGRFIHPSQDRVLSVRECARAQGLPDRLWLKGSMTSCYKQVGNAVPPALAYSIGKNLIPTIKLSSKGN